MAIAGDRSVPLPVTAQWLSEQGTLSAGLHQVEYVLSDWLWAPQVDDVLIWMQRTFSFGHLYVDSFQKHQVDGATLLEGVQTACCWCCLLPLFCGFMHTVADICTQWLIICTQWLILYVHT